jgi:uncharacterized protein (DUF1330 family)
MILAIFQINFSTQLPMPAYILAQINVTDWDGYQEYIKRTPKVIAAFGGRFIARGGKSIDLEGERGDVRTVLIEFPDLAAAEAFYHSPEYQAVKKYRDTTATAKLIAIDGYSQDQWLADVESSL